MIDTPYSILGRCAAIKAAGHGGVIRYISPNTPKFPRKRATLPEVQEAHQHGIAVGFVWETLADFSIFTADNGRAHAKAAVFVLKALGAPAGTAIYFAVDFDAQGKQLAQIGSYFAAARQVVKAAGFRVGGYGSGLVLSHLRAKGLISLAWLAQSPGWTGSEGFERWDILQGKTTRVAGLDVDLNTCKDNPADAGMWTP